MTQSTKALLTDFDNCRGQRVQKLSLTNSHGVTLSVLTLGATLYEINVPDAEGQPHNLVLNYPHSEDYLANPFYVCMAIGRTAGRISKGQFSINGRPVTVPTNEGHNTLHGGHLMVLIRSFGMVNLTTLAQPLPLPCIISSPLKTTVSLEIQMSQFITH
ncbi:aldose epimerase family protein [Furfurilactobacillus rossiae]